MHSENNYQIQQVIYQNDGKDLLDYSLQTNKKHGNAMKPGFQATIALWYLLKLLALGSWCDECIMIYFKTSSFSKLARILQSNWP